jgi:hypothetical protein
VHFEPFLLRRRAQVALEIAARVEPLAAPVGGGDQRNGHLGQIGRALTVIRRIERARQHLEPHVLAVFHELLLGQRLGAAGELAGDGAFPAPLAHAVLNRLDLHVLPVLAERAGQTAMTARIAVGIGPPLPDTDRCKVGRLRRRGPPLVAGVVGDAVHPHLAARPRLSRRPLDAQVNVARLARVVVPEVAGRAPGAARIDANAYVAVGYPLLRIDHLPVRVLVARARYGVGVLPCHDLPGGLVALLKGNALAVRAVAQDDRIAPLGDRTEHIGAQHQPVIHRNRRIPVDPHFIADFAFHRLHAFISFVH